MKKIFLIDWNALIYRMFFAIPDFTTKSWKHVSAIFWIAKFFMQDLVRDNPDYLVFIRDARWENFRHQIYTEYKSTRDRMPDNLRSQVEEINDMVALFHTPVIEIPMVEADDVIATLAIELWKDKENQVFILSWDKDLYSLVTENIKIYDIIKKDVFDIKKTTEKFWVIPPRIIDYLAINWDSSDNIPWIDGIWPKKAVPLINELGTVEEIYDFIDSGKVSENQEIKKILSGKTLEKIVSAREMAFLSKKLATIKFDVDLSSIVIPAKAGIYKDWFNLEAYKFNKDNLVDDEVIELFKKYEFNSLLWKEHIKKEKTWKDLWLKVQIIWDNEWLENLKKLISKRDEFVLDTETTSLNIIEAELVWVSVLIDENHIYYINVAHNWPKLDKAELNDFFKFILNWNFKIIGHNIKYDLEIIELFMRKFDLSNETKSLNKIQKKWTSLFWQMSLLE